jgi:LacI family transcriptional regulator
MGNQQAKLDVIHQIAAPLGVSLDDVNAVLYGEKLTRNEKLLAIIDALANDGHGGVYSCAVWKGDPVQNSARTLPRYDYFGQILEGLNLYLHKKGYTSQLLVNTFQLADYAYFENILVRYPSAGLITLAVPSTEHLRKACQDYERPIVYLDFPVGENTSKQYIISAKNETIIAEVVRYLYGLGHRRIGFVQGLLEKQGAFDRYKGYRRGLMSVGIEVDEALVFAGNWDMAGGKAAAEQFLMLPSPPTAIIASNDLMAFGVMQAVEQWGLKIPDDVSVVGFDDITSAMLTQPPLTSVRAPMTEIGRKAGEYMVQLLEGESPRPYHLYVPLEIIKRESVGPAPMK